MGRSSITGTELAGAKCGALKRNRLSRCTLTAGYGTDHLGVGYCKHHTGNTASGIKAAAKAAVMDRMNAAYGDLIEIDPGAALLQEVHRSQGVVIWIQSMLQDLTGIDLDAPDQAKARTALLEATAFDGWQIKAYVELFFRERKHLAQTAKMTLDAGVAERQVRVEEEKVALVALAVKQIFDELDLSAAQREAFPSIARKHLALLRPPAPVIKAGPLPLSATALPSIPPKAS